MKQNSEFEENILPPLAYFFQEKIIALVGTRPTWYTYDTVSETAVERDINDTMELDPGVSKRSLYQKYAYFHDWKIETIAKGKIINTFCCDVVDD